MTIRSLLLVAEEGIQWSGNLFRGFYSIVSQEGVFNHTHPLRRIGDFEGNSVFHLIIHSKIDFHHGLMQVNSLVLITMVNPRDGITGYGYFQLF